MEQARQKGGKKQQLSAFTAISSSLRGIALKIHPVIYLHSAWQGGLATLHHPALLCALALAVSQITRHAERHIRKIAGYTCIKIYK